MFNPERARPAALPSRRTQHGLTLIELLVAMTIGLLVIGAAIATLILTRASAGSISDLSELQQQGSYALRVIGLQARQAGSVDLVPSAAAGAFQFRADFDGYGGSNLAVAGKEGASGTPDELYFSSQTAGALTQTQGVDCLGNAANFGNGRVDAKFFISSGGDLSCTGTSANGSKTQPIVGNVADFQVLYRVTSAGGTAVQRQTADQVQASGLWSSVSAVEVCLDLQGTETSAPAPGNRNNYINCQGQNVARASGRLHLVLNNVFDLRTQGGS